MVIVSVVLVVGPRRGEIVDWVAEFGAVAPLVGVLVYAILSVVLVPGSLLSVAAGVLFGPLLGTVVAVVGGLVAASVTFGLSRTVLRGPVQRLTGRWREKLDGWVARYGTLGFAYARVVPLVPYGAVNYAGGLTAVRYREFIAGSSLGLVPGAFAYAALGGTVGDPTSPAFFAALALLVGVIIAGPLLQRGLRTEE